MDYKHQNAIVIWKNQLEKLIIVFSLSNKLNHILATVQAFINLQLIN